LKPETIKFIAKPTFNMDTFVDAHLQGSCVYETIAKHSKTSLADNVEKLVKMASANKIENEVVQFVVDECKMKAPVGAHLLKAYMLAAMNCPVVQEEMKQQSRKLQTDDANTVCSSPCPDFGTNCGSCVNQCSVSTLTTCMSSCASAIDSCYTNPTTCYQSVLNCFNGIAGCCACGAYSYYYSCGCC